MASAPIHVVPANGRWAVQIEQQDASASSTVGSQIRLVVVYNAGLMIRHSK
jgi:hypothetical protein